MSHIDLASPEGWDEWVHGPEPVAPKKATAAAFAAMNDDQRWEYDEARRAWHSTPEFFETPHLVPFRRSFVRAVGSQRGQVMLKRGVGLSALGNSGKTIAIANYARNFQLEIEEHDPSLRDGLPVIFTEAVSPKEEDFYQSLARPLDVPYHGVKPGDLREVIIRALKRERTEVIVMDEGMKLYPKTAEGERSTHRMRTISNRTGVVWVVAGVALEQTGMFSGAQASSTKRRWPLFDLAPYQYGNTSNGRNDGDNVDELSDHAFWLAAIDHFERRLILHEHKSGSLVKDAEYLFGRTGGLLGSLADLIEGAAFDAIEYGAEAITRAVLDDVVLDEGATEHYDEWLADKKASARTAKGSTKADKPIGTNTRTRTPTKKVTAKRTAAKSAA